MKPYLVVTKTILTYEWNPNYPADEKCMCNHAYYRHFDTYEDMEPVGCKYCPCYRFVSSEMEK